MKFLAPIISPVGHLQLSIGKLQLRNFSFFNPLYAADIKRYNYHPASYRDPE